MGSPPNASLRVQALAKRLAQHPNALRMIEYATTLDGWIHEWARYGARKDLPRDERVRALSMLASMRRDFNAVLAEADAYDPDPPKGRVSHFGTALDELDDEERGALEQILGVPFERQYRPLFEVKAAEYLEQDELWNDITEDGGFVDVTTLAADEPRAAVVLTYSGSLLLVSSPTEKKNFRRKYVYQSIYAGHLPTEGSLGLLGPIQRNKPVSGTRIKTSPVRKLRISRDTQPEWDIHRETFLRLHRTLNGAATPGPVVLAPPAPVPPPRIPEDAPPPAPPAGAPKPKLPPPRPRNVATVYDGTPMAVASAQSAPPAPPEPRASEAPPEAAPLSRSGGPVSGDNRIPSIFVQVLHTERQRDHVKKLEEAARAELRTLLARLIETAGERDHALEAEIIGQVMYLQRLAIERGELSVPPAQLVRLETENNDLCTSVPDGLAIGKLGAPSASIADANFGGQTIVRGAPIAVLSKDSSLFAVLGNVRSYVRRA